MYNSNIPKPEFSIGDTVKVYPIDDFNVFESFLGFIIWCDVEVHSIDSESFDYCLYIPDQRKETAWIGEGKHMRNCRMILLEKRLKSFKW